MFRALDGSDAVTAMFAVACARRRGRGLLPGQADRSDRRFRFPAAATTPMPGCWRAISGTSSRQSESGRAEHGRVPAVCARPTTSTTPPPGTAR